VPQTSIAPAVCSTLYSFLYNRAVFCRPCDYVYISSDGGINLVTNDLAYKVVTWPNLHRNVWQYKPLNVFRVELYGELYRLKIPTHRMNWIEPDCIYNAKCDIYVIIYRATFIQHGLHNYVVIHGPSCYTYTSLHSIGAGQVSQRVARRRPIVSVNNKWKRFVRKTQ